MQIKTVIKNYESIGDYLADLHHNEQLCNEYELDTDLLATLYNRALQTRQTLDDIALAEALKHA